MLVRSALESHLLCIFSLISHISRTYVRSSLQFYSTNDVSQYSASSKADILNSGTIVASLFFESVFGAKAQKALTVFVALRYDLRNHFIWSSTLIWRYVTARLGKLFYAYEVCPTSTHRPLVVRRVSSDLFGCLRKLSYLTTKTIECPHECTSQVQYRFFVSECISRRTAPHA